jgi:hypothetical protein
MPKISRKTIVAALALAVGMTGAAQAEPFNIFTASQANNAKLATIRHRHHHHHHGSNPGLAAIGVIGGIAAGAAIASQNDRYYDDDYYDRRRYYDGPPVRYYDDDGDGYCVDNGGRPAHYPAPPGC